MRSRCGHYTVALPLFELRELCRSFADDGDDAATFQPKRRGAPRLSEEAKAAALETAKEGRRVSRAIDREIDCRLRDEKERAMRDGPALLDIKIHRSPHPASVPSAALIADIQRILGRPEPPDVDFEHTPAYTFAMPIKHPHLPGEWVYRDLYKGPAATYTVRDVTRNEREKHCVCPKLHALSCPIRSKYL